MTNVREYKIEKFKLDTWSPGLESYFLAQKPKLDRVIYSLLRTKNQEVATELYFRIVAGEQSFAQLANEYSEGPEAQTLGLIGPVALSALQKELVQMLSVSQPSQLCPPTRLGEWFVIVRLEKFMPAQLDATMRQQLLNSLFEAWISKQVQKEMKKWVAFQREQDVESEAEGEREKSGRMGEWGSGGNVFPSSSLPPSPSYPLKSKATDCICEADKSLTSVAL